MKKRSKIIISILIIPIIFAGLATAGYLTIGVLVDPQIFLLPLSVGMINFWIIYAMIIISPFLCIYGIYVVSNWEVDHDNQ